MYVNGKMIPIQTISGMGAGESRIKNNIGGCKFRYDILEQLL
jgi:hypothetical protein